MTRNLSFLIVSLLFLCFTIILLLPVPKLSFQWKWFQKPSDYHGIAFRTLKWRRVVHFGARILAGLVRHYSPRLVWLWESGVCPAGAAAV